jgi:hypothetical protein
VISRLDRLAPLLWLSVYAFTNFLDFGHHAITHNSPSPSWQRNNHLIGVRSPLRRAFIPNLSMGSHSERTDLVVSIIFELAVSVFVSFPSSCTYPLMPPLRHHRRETE